MKKLKVFYMGERLKEVYPHATKWQVFKFKVRQFFRKVLQVLTIGGVTGGALYIAFISGQFSAPSHVQAEKVDNLPAKIEVLKEEVLKDLSTGCEIKGFKPEDGVIIFDTNGKASIGAFMFQKSTVVHYYKVLYQKDITGQEAVAIANDHERAKQLASDIIFTHKNGVGKDWVNCDKKLGLTAKVNLIKKLMQ